MLEKENKPLLPAGYVNLCIAKPESNQLYYWWRHSTRCVLPLSSECRTNSVLSLSLSLLE
jgi:hypothetical protein